MKKVKIHLQEYRDLLIPPKVGEIVKGKVIDKVKNGILLEIGNYKIGIIKKNDLSAAGENLSKMEKGKEIMAKIIDLDNKDNLVELSLREASKDLTWENLQELNDKKGTVLLKAVGANKGGLIFNYSGMQGFLPASQLSRKNYPKVESPTPDKIYQELKKFIGKEMELKVISADPRRQKLIFSEKE
ncbi:MAG: S1 RNA-binding domain-containing protein [Patescibacteria group bacterium]